MITINLPAKQTRKCSSEWIGHVWLQSNLKRILSNQQSARRRTSCERLMHSTNSFGCKRTARTIEMSTTSGTCNQITCSDKPLVNHEPDATRDGKSKSVSKHDRDCGEMSIPMLVSVNRSSNKCRSKCTINSVSLVFFSSQSSWNSYDPCWGIETLRVFSIFFVNECNVAFSFGLQRTRNQLQSSPPD